MKPNCTRCGRQPGRGMSGYAADGWFYCSNECAAAAIAVAAERAAVVAYIREESARFANCSMTGTDPYAARLLHKLAFEIERGEHEPKAGTGTGEKQ